MIFGTLIMKMEWPKNQQSSQKMKALENGTEQLQIFYNKEEQKFQKKIKP